MYRYKWQKIITQWIDKGLRTKSFYLEKYNAPYKCRLLLKVLHIFVSVVKIDVFQMYIWTVEFTSKKSFFCLREHVALLIFNAQKMLVFFFNLDRIYSDIFLQIGFLREPIWKKNMLISVKSFNRSKSYIFKIQIKL